MVGRRRVELVKAEIQQDLAACNEYIEKHGSFADYVRDHYRRDENG